MLAVVADESNIPDALILAVRPQYLLVDAKILVYEFVSSWRLPPGAIR